LAVPIRPGGSLALQWSLSTIEEALP